MFFFNGHNLNKRWTKYNTVESGQNFTQNIMYLKWTNCSKRWTNWLKKGGQLGEKKVDKVFPKKVVKVVPKKVEKLVKKVDTHEYILNISEINLAWKT